MSDRLSKKHVRQITCLEKMPQRGQAPVANHRGRRLGQGPTVPPRPSPERARVGRQGGSPVAWQVQVRYLGSHLGDTVMHRLPARLLDGKNAQGYSLSLYCRDLVQNEGLGKP